MHIHILGICGTFMGGVAVLAKAAGHRVTGCDAHVYPPMSTQLREQGIDLIEGYSEDQLALKPDLYVIGNVVSRGNPLMEAILNRGLPYQSGPQWIGEHILRDKWVLAVAGTHGKTTTSSMLAWILEDANYHPGFLIGGIPLNFNVSARLPDANKSPYFVIEADEYDTAFFDKRSKFVHYHPKTAILNNLEFDHADIFANLEAIETQFHHLVRTIAGNGKIIVNDNEASLKRVLAKGCWCQTEFFGRQSNTRWTVDNYTGSSFDVYDYQNKVGTVQWELTGEHNAWNALAAIGAANHVGIKPQKAIDALSRFLNVKRRMECRGTVLGVSVYDDFAHHPTAIETTIDGLRKKMGRGRLIALLEPRSNTMKLGVMKDALSQSLSKADVVIGYGEKTGKNQLDWDLSRALLPLGEKAKVFHDLNLLIDYVVEIAQANDHILIMSNGGFGGIHQKILDRLAKK